MPKVQSHPQLLSQGTDNLIIHYKHLIMAICSISGIYGYLKGLYYLWLSPFKVGYLIRPKQNFRHTVVCRTRISTEISENRGQVSQVVLLDIPEEMKM